LSLDWHVCLDIFFGLIMTCLDAFATSPCKLLEPSVCAIGGRARASSFSTSTLASRLARPALAATDVQHVARHNLVS
jgi:hypothetical protein